jgi:hypothetical protein
MDPGSSEKSSPLIDKLRRQMEEAGKEEVPASVYRAEHAHWSANHASRSDVKVGDAYDDYAPAYLYGVFWYFSNPDRTFETSEIDLENGWNSARADSPIEWARAKPAAREAWYRVRDLAAQAASERNGVLSTSSEPQMPGDH